MFTKEHKVFSGIGLLYRARHQDYAELLQSTDKMKCFREIDEHSNWVFVSASDDFLFPEQFVLNFLVQFLLSKT